MKKRKRNPSLKKFNKGYFFTEKIDIITSDSDIISRFKHIDSSVY